MGSALAEHETQIDKMPVRVKTRRQLQVQAARRALFWGIACFFALQGALAIASEFWLPELRNPPFWSKVRRLQARIDNAQQPPLTLVMLGSSCTAFGFQGQVLEKSWSSRSARPIVAYNLGVYGSGPLGHLLGLERLLRQGLRPSVALIEIFPPKLAKTLDPSDVRIATMQYADLRTVQRFVPDQAATNVWWQTSFCPVAEDRVAILSGLAPRLLPWNQRVEWWKNADQSGWVPLKASPTEQSMDANSPAMKKWKRQLQRFEPGGAGFKALSDLLALCRKENIQAVLVGMPEGPFFRSLYPPAAWEKAERMLAEISRTESVPLIDARMWFDEEAFLDSHHLNARGAAQFTARLDQALQPLLSTVK